MKTTFKVIAAVLALGAVILLGLHLFLQYGLTKAMREVVLPRVRQETGIDVRVGRLSLNVPNGILHLKDLTVRNPEGFLLENLASIERVDVEVDVLSLIRQELVVVKNIEVEHSLLNVVRNKDGEINLNKLQQGLPQPAEPSPAMSGQEATQQPLPKPSAAREPMEVPSVDAPPKTPKPAPQKPPAELLIEALQCDAKVRYIDLKLNHLDIALDLSLIGINLSTRSDPAARWGDISIIGSLGSDRTSFLTDLKIRLAPLVEPAAPTFDLSGKVLEIDPRIMEDVYADLGIRSAPFGLDPDLHCRAGYFHDSSIALNLSKVRLEEKLARRLGGMARIESLRFSVPIEGTLRQPSANLKKALQGAVGGNVQGLLDSFLKGTAAKEAGLDEPPETLGDAAVEVLGEQVEEIGKSETAKKVLKDLAGGAGSDTNAPPSVTTDVMVDLLGEQVEEIGENEELKNDLKNLGKLLFGK